MDLTVSGKEPTVDPGFLKTCHQSWFAFRAACGKVRVKKVSDNWKVSRHVRGRTPASRAEGASYSGDGEGGGARIASWQCRGGQGSLRTGTGLPLTCTSSSNTVPDLYLNE